MKKRDTLRQQLGITQDAMAALLQIKRSHWSMYEINKRELPTSAIHKMAEIELFLHSLSAKGANETKLEPQKRQQFLEEAVLENKFARETILRAIKAKEIKKQTHENALKLVEYLASRSEDKAPIPNEILKTIVGDKAPIPNAMLETIAARAKKNLARHTDDQLAALYFRHEVLKQEEAWLKKALKTK